ncbi:hypothetical protein HDU79_007979 [Rhizoclosmatium sp. JEL0117]|nr:hypothetical protein HDU79_007979 [Rhizoclosmatium sp. JEL0117]
MSTTRKQAITKTDRAERNRLAQQAHQQRKRDRLRNLEAQVKYLETLLESKGNMCLTDCGEPPISNSGELASGITPSGLNSRSNTTIHTMHLSNLLNSEDEDEDRTTPEPLPSSTAKASNQTWNKQENDEYYLENLRHLPAPLRRKLQNRLAQRKCREAKNNHINELEKKLSALFEKYQQLRPEYTREELFASAMTFAKDD